MTPGSLALQKTALGGFYTPFFKIFLNILIKVDEVPGFDSLECACRRGTQSRKNLSFECRIRVEKWNRKWEEDRRRAAFGRICLDEMLNWPIMVRIFLISIQHVSGREHNPLDWFYNKKKRASAAPLRPMADVLYDNLQRRTGIVSEEMMYRRGAYPYV